MTDDELRRIAQIDYDDKLVTRMAEEFREGLVRPDAYDYFAQQARTQKNQLVTLVLCTLFGVAMVSFIASIMLVLALGMTGWALGFSLAAAVLALTATLLGTCAPMR